MRRNRSTSAEESQTIRISLPWLILAFLIILLLGAVGGLAGQQLGRPALPPLTDGEGGQLVSTIQEVTISPNQAAAEIVKNSQRSVMALVPAGEDERAVVGSGLVITSDGLVVTAANDLSGELVAIDDEGREIALGKVGEDALFGLTYYRLGSGVFVPLEMQEADPPVATTLLAIGRDVASHTPRILSYQVREHVLPGASFPAGIQKLLAAARLEDATFAGSPLLDDEGKVGGLVIDTEQGLALPISLLRVSLDRVIQQQREADPFASLGLDIRYTFRAPAAGEPPLFVAEVIASQPGTAAAIAGLRRGDLITHIGEEALTWDKPVAPQLAASLPLALKIQRGTETHTVTLQAVPQ